MFVRKGFVLPNLVSEKREESENDFLMVSNFLLYLSKSYYKICSIVPNRALRNALKFQGPLENTINFYSLTSLQRVQKCVTALEPLVVHRSRGPTCCNQWE